MAKNDSVRDASLLIPSDAEAFCRQENTFAVFNLTLLGVLFAIHTLFSAHFGHPSPALIWVFAVGFLSLVIELVWLNGGNPALTRRTVLVLSTASIGFNSALALGLALLTDRQDSPYFVLLVVPVLVSAFRLALPFVLAVAGLATSIAFFWVWHFNRFHGPVPATEYFEAGSLSLIFSIISVLAWSLVDSLRRNERRLHESLGELQRTRERLVQEEKLAAIGRLSSAIAHEVRNPVAMISSSLASAVRGTLSDSQREEMFDIAAHEASRLEQLTADFLAYARPRVPQRRTTSLLDTVQYIASACRARAAERGVEIEVVGEEVIAEVDQAQLQQAILNLVLNAVDASPNGGRIRITLLRAGSSAAVDVENDGAIPAEAQHQLFEPFFTTKESGTGLGLAIARNLVHANGGEVELADSGPPTVRLRITLPATRAGKALREGACQGS